MFRLTLDVKIKPRRYSPIRLFGSIKRAEKIIERSQTRAEREYRPLYKDGRAKALERAEVVALEKVAEAESVDPEQLEKDQAKIEAGFWDKVKKVARQLPYLDDLLASYFAMRDTNTPLQARAALVFGLLYFLWVFDIIPDFLGIIGYADDGTVREEPCARSESTAEPFKVVLSPHVLRGFSESSLALQAASTFMRPENAS